MTTPTDILKFWFGDSFQNGLPVDNRNALWFGFNPEQDLLIKHRYSNDVMRAAKGGYDDWKETPEGRLALIILLDQFPRNIYRGNRQAFAFDTQALEICLEGLKQGDDQQLILIHRCFFYLPLEHSESLAMQEKCVNLFETLYANTASDAEDAVKNSLDYARLHYEIIAKFGRFPHRNELLSRPSTVEEIAYLKASGTNFGQGNKKQD